MARDSGSSSKVTSEEIDAIKADLETLKDDLSSLVDTLKGRATGKAERLKDRAKSQWDEQISSIEETIEERPFTAVLIALGVGLFLGKLISLK